MVEFKVGDRVIVRSYPPNGADALVGRVGRVTRVPADGGWVDVRLSKVPGCGDHRYWLLHPSELTLAPSRRADLSPDDNQAVHCYCAKESPLGSYTSSEGHYQEEDE